ncbi:4Fe-4S binding protein [bacterium]|nr:4Fe-4S binding protein [bacterium]
MLLRRISQILFFLIFLFFFFNTKYTGLDELPLKVAVFLNLDPLINFAVFLSERNLSALLSISLIIIFISFFLGRVFCGWVCPFGTIHDVTSRMVTRKKGVENGRFKWKYYILILLLVSSLLSLNLEGFLDPIALLIRTLSVSLSPLFDYFSNHAENAIYSTKIGFFTSISDFIFDFLKRYFLNFKQQYFHQSALILILFIVFILLNRLSNRFFCKNLCPLGAYLGCFARFGFLKRNLLENCISCGKCLDGCKMTIEKETQWRRSECLLCMRCKDVCPTKSIEFTLALPNKQDKGFDLGRRKIITSSVYGVLLVGGIRLNPIDKGSIPRLIRPPGSVPEDEFKRRCIKCGECMRVCLTNVLQPTLLQTGVDGLWTPHLDFGVGYCEYYCTLCTQVCPSGAIEKLDMKKKTKTVIGLAYIDPSRCIPYREASNCIVCEEFCPTSPKAIYFEKAIKKTRDGTEIEVKLPKVDYKLCIGCGVC